MNEMANNFLKQLDERITLLESRLEKEKDCYILDIQKGNFDPNTKAIELNAKLVELKEQRQMFLLCFRVYT